MKESRLNRSKFPEALIMLMPQEIYVINCM